MFLERDMQVNIFFLYATLQSRVLSNVLGVAKTSGVTGETIDFRDILIIYHCFK